MASQNKIFRIHSNDVDEFFIQWVEMLSPRIGRAAQKLPNLTDKQRMDLKNGLSSQRREVLAELLKARYYLSFKISDPEILDKEAVSPNTKKQIREKCGISSANFNNLISLFRSAKILSNVGGVDKINPSFIPDISEGVLVLSFKFTIGENK